MKLRSLAAVFAVVLVIHLLALWVDWLMIAQITKPLLMITIAAYFMAAVKGNSRLKIFILLALLFSWLGDVLLMFQSRDSLFFLLGLSSFLVAHLFYIFFFDKIRKQENLKSRIWTLLVIAVYYSVLITILNPWLGEMKFPVRVYGLVISFMLMLALHMFYLENKPAGKYMAAGAILFVISDSVLAVNKFFRPLPQADVVIMLTYALAQFSMVHGAYLFLSSVRRVNG